MDKKVLGTASTDVTYTKLQDTIPSNDVVHSPDENTELTVFVKTYNHTPQHLQEAIANFFEVVFSEPTGTSSIVDSDNLLSINGENITIDTANRSESGFLELKVGGLFDVSGLKAKGLIKETRVIPVRPSTQNTSFPPGFVAFHDLLLSFRSSTCRSGTRCILTCTALGNDISRINVEEVLQNGMHKVVPSTQLFPYRTPISQTISWIFTPDEDSGDADGFVKFLCSANDDIHKTEAMEELRVKVLVDPSIVSDKSHIELKSDPTNSTRKEVTFVCAVRGRPLPSVDSQGDSGILDVKVPNVMVSFQSDSLNVFGSLDDNNRTVIRTSDRLESIVAHSVTVDADSFIELQTQIQADNATAPYCKIKSRIAWILPWLDIETFTYL
ncbi:hypothetical protein PoB_003686300 [Plakobranchus ocellatus]|uniref:Ig-like domain-containing protein n=1 Tax=Plakobranchus ocellatus TaxID=259542 RepID=A0AAV4ASK5_9GAST|nr:hypothetical protein PoB_003686300 [Plakobranchus ocellatus]